ncbi:MAG: type I methionyl aminopeptidase [Ignavibacteriales bacterium]|nr:type I methionyl aminopeptidase [Ignavibacteriales bacterium]MCB9218593.1 type I methionyl aminopeptidase [Ignavibacteriales bacterium]
MILIKSKKEIDYIRESSKIVAETLQLVKSYAEVGKSTLELDKIAEDYIRSNNAVPAFKGYSQAGSIDFPGTICSSLNEEVVHGIPGNRILQNGDILSVDVGVLKNGYFGDAAISIAVGDVDKEVLRLMEVTEKSLYIGIEQAKVNNRIGDISFAIQEYIESNGFSIVRDLCGHGVGKYLHEDPQIPNFGKANSGAKIKNGMTFAIEPMINMGNYEVQVANDGWTVVTKDRKPSAHYEHTIAIINNVAEILSVS